MNFYTKMFMFRMALILALAGGFFMDWRRSILMDKIIAAQKEQIDSQTILISILNAKCEASRLGKHTIVLSRN